MRHLVSKMYVERKFSPEAKNNAGNFTEQSPFVRIYEAYRMAAFGDLMKKLSTPYSASNEWSGSPTDVTFGYDASSNTIYLPAGVLQPPAVLSKLSRSCQLWSSWFHDRP
ncbi:hypothetical protein MTO96_023529 [Rhipicephalus appendiculatus]